MMSGNLVKRAGHRAPRHEPRRLLRLIAALVASLTILSPRPAHGAPSIPSISAPEAIVLDGWTGNVLYARNPDRERDPASTVKIMTAFVLLDRGPPLSRVVTVSPLAASYGGSSAHLYPGERMTLWDLLHGMLLPSGNDAAVALAEATAGTTARFVSLMNAEAVRLHLRHTHYLTPNGLDSWGQVTTARDLARLARAAMQRPAFAQTVRMRSWFARSADGTIWHRWSNLNKLLWQSPVVDGIKTGTTPGAGACLVSSARRNGKWVIAVNLGSSVARRFSDGAALLSYGLAVDGGAPSAH